MTRTKIEWCDFTWNPVVGCTGACPYCYARRMATRFHRDFTPHWVEKNFQRAMPKKPSRIFVNSMSDLADWEPIWLSRVDMKMVEHPEHRFLFLTKRPWACDWTPPAAMLGYSVTRQEDIERFLEAGKGRRFGVEFLSIEPILGPVALPEKWSRIGWIIVGAETGNRRGKVIPEVQWLRDIYDYTRKQGIPLFFKDSLRTRWPYNGYQDFPQEYPV